MKITDSEIIKSGEQELIDAITADLDWGAIEEIFMKEHNLGIEEDIEYKNGDIVAVDDRIAYKLEFTVKVNLSVLLDRNGEYLSVCINNKIDNKGPGTEIDEHDGLEVTDSDYDSDKEEPLEITSDGIDDEQVIENESSSDEAGEKIAAPVDEIDEADELDPVDEVNKSTDENLEEDDPDPFGDLSGDDSDDMGQKVDDMLENIKKTG